MKDKYCTLLFLVRGDEVLLAMKKRGFGSDRYNGVGGKIEPGETVEQALVRECQEEIGVTPTTYYKVAEHDFEMDVDSDKPWRMFVHAYIATEWDGEPVETEEMAPEWFKKAEVPYDNMWQDDPYWLPQVLNGNKIVGIYEFLTDETMVRHDVQVVDELPGLIPTGPAAP
jgi:mutator protein MutT